MENELRDIIGPKAEKELVTFLWHSVNNVLKDFGLSLSRGDIDLYRRKKDESFYHNRLSFGALYIVYISPVTENGLLDITINGELHSGKVYDDDCSDSEEAAENLYMLLKVGLDKVRDRIIEETKQEIMIGDNYQLIPLNLSLDPKKSKGVAQYAEYTIYFLYCKFTFDLIDLEAYKPPEEAGGQGGAEYEKRKRETKVGKQLNH